MKKKITVIGSGGTALAAAVTFTANGHEVTLTDTPEHQKVFEDAKKSGFVRARIDGVMADLEDTARESSMNWDTRSWLSMCVRTESILFCPM